MFTKLAARNVKRQIGNYLIYYITVSLTVALMFAVNNAIFEKQLLARAASIDELRTALITVTVFISAVVAFVLGYATSFMLKLRKREFGMYLTLGMTRRNVLGVFLLESLILCAVSLATGLVLGLAFYQGIMAIVTNIMDVRYSFAAYSLQGLLLTVGLVAGVFALSAVTSALYLRRVSINSLLHDAQKSERTVKHPVPWAVLAVATLAVIVTCCIFIRSEIIASANDRGSLALITICVIALIISIVLFHVGLCKSMFGLLLRSARFKNNGTNTFTLRKLSSKLSANAVMAGILALLMTFAVAGANASFLMQTANNAALDRSYPFDVFGEIPYDSDSPVDMATAQKTVAEFSAITREADYTIYTSGKNYLHGFTDWHGENYSELYDEFITESEFNALYGLLGYPQLKLDGGFAIVSHFAYAKDVEACDFSAAQLRIGERTLDFKGFANAPLTALRFFLAVVPDAAIDGLAACADGWACMLDSDGFDAQALHDRLTYENTNGQLQFSRCDFVIKQYHKIQSDAESAVFIVTALYVALVFVFMAMAMLALKTLSDMADDRKHYDTLFRLGASKRDMTRTLFRQTFAFFFIPFALPLLFGIPTAAICYALMQTAGFAAIASKTINIAFGVAAVITAVYALYFAATYLTAKRNVIRRV